MDLMNRVYKPYLDKFVIVFIDDISICSSRNKEYEERLRLILGLLKNKELYIHKAQVESPKTKNVKDENLHGMDKELRLVLIELLALGAGYLADETLAIPLDEIQIDEKPHFIEELVEIMDREVKRQKQSRIPIFNVRWNSKRGPEFTWEREDQMQKKYSIFLLILNLRRSYVLSFEDKAL
ncbi:hypothetical protein Tco_0927606 [Tanacetum coccineum]